MSIKQWCPLTRSAEILGDKWSLLILRELVVGPQRFKTLKQNIPGISMDQLTRKLDHLCQQHMIVRQEFSEAPPRVEYQLTEMGQSFQPVLRRIFLWGSQNLWGVKKSNEVVDIALSLRLAATFLGQGEGVVEVIIRSSVEAQQGRWLVERHSSGRVFVGKNIKEAIDTQVEVSYLDWLKIVSRKSFNQTLRVKIRIKGDSRLLENIIPIFRNIHSDELYSTDREFRSMPELGV